MINNIYTNVLGLALVLFPAVVWERFNDRKGDLNKKADVFYRGALMFLAANINTLLNAGNCEDWRRTLTFLLLSINLSISSFFLLFDYWITYTLIKRGIIETPGAHWFTYMRKGGFDAWEPWAKLSPRTRFIIRAGYFVVSLVIYFIWK
jgi:hypothetical protein